MTHLMILLDIIQKDDTNLRNEIQKRMVWTYMQNPVEHLRWSFYEKIVKVTNFIVDIRPGSKYPADEQNTF